MYIEQFGSSLLFATPPQKKKYICMRSISILVFFTLLSLFVCAQSSKNSGTTKWIKVHDDDEMVMIYYNSNVETDKKGRLLYG